MRDSTASSSHLGVIKIAFAAALGGFLFGYDTAVINGAVEAIQSPQAGFGLTPGELGFAVAIVLGGAAIGSWFAGSFAQRWGRVRVMVCAALLFSISALGSGLAFGFWDFAWWRMVGGIGVGCAAVIAPAYIAEVSPAHLRGRLGSLQQLAIAVGLFASFVINAGIAYLAGSPSDSWWGGLSAWRWMLMAELIPAILYGLIALRLPESPRYLVSTGQQATAVRIMREMGIDPNPQQRVRLIEQTLDQDHPPSVRDITDRKTLLKPIVWTAIALAFIAQFSGINIILYYASSLWRAVGFSAGLALVVPIGTTLIGIIMTVVGMLLIDRIGRKKLLIIGSIGMAVSLIAVGLIFFRAETVDGQLRLSEQLSWSALILAHVFYIFFCGTWGPALWVLLGEMFPNRLRTSGLAIATFANWIGNVIVTWSFPLMLVGIGLGWTYLFYGACCLLSLLLVTRWIPETLNKELEDMQDGV